MVVGYGSKPLHLDGIRIVTEYHEQNIPLLYEYHPATWYSVDCILQEEYHSEYS